MTVPGTDVRHHTLVVLVENKAGVLARAASLFARRGFNIFSLAVAPTEDERFSRITIVVDVASAPLEQITKQLYKLVNVVKISELDPRDSVERELMLVTVRADVTARSQVIELVYLFEGRVVDVGHDELTVSIDGEPDRLDDVEALLRPFGIVELQRTAWRCRSSSTTLPPSAPRAPPDRRAAPTPDQEGPIHDGNYSRRTPTGRSRRPQGGGDRLRLAGPPST